MYYTYVLFSQKSKRLYIGFSSNLKDRIADHNAKRGGKYSRSNAPFQLVYYEAYLAKEDATKQEVFYKSGYGREVLNDKIKKSLKLLRA
jgi:putative endonuclease